MNAATSYVDLLTNFTHAKVVYTSINGTTGETEKYYFEITVYGGETVNGQAAVKVVMEFYGEGESLRTLPYGLLLTIPTLSKLFFLTVLK